MHQDLVFVYVSMCFYYHFVCYCKFLLLVYSATGFTNIPPVIITVIIVSCFVLCCSLIWSNEHHCRYVYVSFSLSQLTCYYICMLQETGCVITVWSIVSLLASDHSIFYSMAPKMRLKTIWESYSHTCLLRCTCSQVDLLK